MKTRITTIALILLLVALVRIGAAENYGLWVTGGDGEHFDKGPKMEEWAREFADLMKGRGVNNMDSAKSKDELKAAIKRLKGKVKCGDSIVFYFNGHGAPTGGDLSFSRGGRVVASVSAAELARWFLEEAGLKDICTCKVHIVIHACYSGNFIKDLMPRDTHIIVAQSSTGGTTAHGDVVPNGDGSYGWGGRDWPTGFNESLAGVPKDKSFQDAIQEANKGGKGKMREEWQKSDKPQTWKRFAGHVEEVVQPEPGGDKTVKLKDKSGAIRTIVMKSGSTIRVGDKNLPFCLLNVCSDANIMVQESAGIYVARSSRVSLNIENAWGHVQVVDREKGLIEIHFDEPEFLKGTTRTFKWKSTDPLPDWLRECKWVTITEGHLDTVLTLGGVTERESPEVEFYGHVRSSDPAKGEFEVHIFRPDWQFCHTRKVKVKEGEKLPAWVQECKWVKFKGKLSDSITGATGITNADPQKLVYAGHVREVKDGAVTFHVQDPEWLFCEVRTWKLPPGRKLPEWVKPCRWARVRGVITADSIKLDSFGQLGWVLSADPVKLNIKGHIEAVGDGWIDVLVAEPPALKGKVVRVRPKDGKVPPGMTPCHDITFTGNMTYDSIINAAKLAIVGQPTRTSDAGVRNIVAPRLEVAARTPVVPEAVVQNYGGDTIQMMSVLCRVDSAGTRVHEDTRNLAAALAPGGTSDVTFGPWTPDGPGNNYDVTFETRLDGDSNPDNDRLARQVFTGAVPNQAPVLDSGDVMPDTGQATMPFAYVVRYRDADGDAPAQHLVVIDGTPQTMMPAGGDPVGGLRFVYQAQLSPGEHWFLFQFDDGNGHIVKTETYQGPFVSGH
jgi:hypothetical protein